ncbi:MAG TPA: hypothetical protein DDX91_09420 [Ruminococcaceae bacterium]|nr:hypothetical protein [Oscillospiraceae bacterium]
MLPNVARYQLRYTPISEISQSGQTYNPIRKINAKEPYVKSKNIITQPIKKIKQKIQAAQNKETAI